MKMSNEWYDFLCWIGETALPSFAVFYKAIAEIWGLPYADRISLTIMAFVVLLNSYLNKSSKAYYQRLAQMVAEAEGTDVEDIEHQAKADNDEYLG